MSFQALGQLNPLRMYHSTFFGNERVKTRLRKRHIFLCVHSAPFFHRKTIAYVVLAYSTVSVCACPECVTTFSMSEWSVYLSKLPYFDVYFMHVYCSTLLCTYLCKLLYFSVYLNVFYFVAFLFMYYALYFVVCSMYCSLLSVTSEYVHSVPDQRPISNYGTATKRSITQRLCHLM